MSHGSLWSILLVLSILAALAIAISSGADRGYQKPCPVTSSADHHRHHHPPRGC